MVFNICVKVHENMSSGFKIMERTRKLLTHTQRERERERQRERERERERALSREREREREREKTKTIYPNGIIRMPGYK